MKMEYR